MSEVRPDPPDTGTERDWFRTVLDGQEGVPARWTEDDPDGEFRLTPGDSPRGILEDYLAACAESREVSARRVADAARPPNLRSTGAHH